MIIPRCLDCKKTLSKKGATYCKKCVFKHFIPPKAFVKGHNAWNKGKKVMPCGAKHPNWKGGLPNCRECNKKLTNYDAKLCGLCNLKSRVGPRKIEIGYRGIHVWINKILGKSAKCTKCGRDGLVSKKIHWANISGQYKRDAHDWTRLCVPCHKKYDLSKKKVADKIEQLVS